MYCHKISENVSIDTVSRVSVEATATMVVVVNQDTVGEVKINGEVKQVKRFTWMNSKNKVKVQLLTYGGCISSVEVPDKNGKMEDIVIGFNNFTDYLKPENAYFGASIGRVANRIKKGEMTVENVKYKLATNNGSNHLHGGVRGYDKVLWDSYVQGNKVILSYLSPNMEEGYPGDLLVNITFELTERNEFTMDYKATTTKPTPVNLTNHSYFNLGGSDSGAKELYNHVFSINADKITEVDSESIPTGKFLPVSGTVFDLRVPTKLADVIHKVPNSPGYDHNYCVTNGTEQKYTFVAKVLHPASGRTMEVYSDQPGVQFYTGNFLPEHNVLKGKTGYIQKHGAFCLETQSYPDSINQPNFPDIILHPGQIYQHKAVYKFGIE